jgi:alkanesulfonate monooxygenase SsuD/methylene tetrahydromethanopterin reductase-like flavin-dependent oxidoreductase (luciferase family)
MSCSVVGARETVVRGVADFAAQTGADELMVVSAIHDPLKRQRSYELLAEAG